MNLRKTTISLLLRLSGNKILNYLEVEKEFEKFTPAELKLKQKERLEQLIKHANEFVPYYKEAFSKINFINERGFIDWDSFNEIPVLTKDIIRSRNNDLISTDLRYKKRKPYRNTSGGSTGEPVEFIQDKMYLEQNIANKLYYKTFVGQDIGDPEIRLWGSEKDILEGSESIIKRLKSWLYNRTDLNAFLMNEDKLIQFVNIINKRQPEWIEAYVQSMVELARFCKKRKLKIYQPKGILTSAGTLYTEMEKEIREVFKCPIFNRYGSREVGDMACSCEENMGLHLNTLGHFFEILDELGDEVQPGESGIVHVTSLTNYTMPLIRYRVGDIATKATNPVCKCGRPWPLIKDIRGREVNIFKTTTGDKIDGEFFTHLFYHKAWCAKFQVIQEELEKITIRIVKTTKRKLSENEINDIESPIKKVMGNNCKINWEFLDNIDPLKSGKYLYTISKI